MPNEPRILTDEEIDELTQQLANSTHGFGGAYKGRTIADLIATVRHERARADEAEQLLAGLALEHPPELATSCYCCGAFLSGPHRQDCAWQLAREHLAQRAKESVGHD